MKNSSYKERYKFAKCFSLYILFIHLLYGITEYIFDYVLLAFLTFMSFSIIFVISYFIIDMEYDYEKVEKKSMMILLVITGFFTIAVWEYNPFFSLFLLTAPIASIIVTSFKNTVYISLFAFSIILLAPFINNYFGITSYLGTPTKKFTNVVVYETFFLIIGFILLSIYFHLKLFRKKIEYEIKQESNTESASYILENPEYGSNLNKEEILYLEILKYFEENQPWRNPEFNVAKLAQALDSNTYYISSAINKVAKKNFNSFINEYRVNQVKNDIDNKLHKKFTIKYIYTEAGFLNQSTFNRVFKEFCGVTPTQYINKANDTD